MQQQQIELMGRIFGELNYDYALKGDCDEYVVPDPASGVTIQEAVREADVVGAVYSTGVNVLHDTTHESRLDPQQDVMQQRHLAVLSQHYCKVNLLARTGYDRGLRTDSGGHRVAMDLPVHASQSFVMLHLGWCDVPMWGERASHRLAFDRDNSFKAYIEDCDRLFASLTARADTALPLDHSMAAARRELCFTDGVRVERANKFREGNFPWGGDRDYLVRLDDRYHGCIG